MTESVVRTTCPYCGVGCGVLVSRSGGGFTVRGDPDHPANRGRLCSKGSALAETLDLSDRLLHPEIHGRRVSWDTALDEVARRFRQVIAEHGPDAVAFYVSGQLLTEDYYVANKLMKGGIGSANIDTNSRLCMSSAVAAHKRAFGTDAVPACYDDLELADLVVLVGSNAAWTHPVVFQRLVAARKARPEMKVVVIDPRRTATCEILNPGVDLHLPLAPGSDAWLFNGLLDFLRREGAMDWSWMEAHVEGFGAALAAVEGLSIPQVALHCGLAEADVAAFYRLFTTTPRTLTLFSQGINQSSSGVDKGNAIINVHLATGRVGRPGASPFSLTGQPNAMGGREVGGLANQLAAHMDFDAEDVDRLGRFWRLPGVARRPGLKAVEMFEAVGEGRIKALWIMATNPVVSMPEADRVAKALKGCEFVVLSDVTASTDTARLAHVLLPAAAWGEKEGTVTNSERRISRQRAFMPSPGGARPDWWIVSEVARRLGYGQQFDYAGPADIFAEHAALSGFENDGRRDFDLSGLVRLDALAYGTLAPVQWPVTSHGGTPRLFADGRFFTPSGKARMIAIAPRPPAHAPDTAHPLVLNTGRIRDQWHTMTRTGKAARLLAHIAEPFVEIHPNDARAAGVTDGGLARLHNGNGEMLARVVENTGQRPGCVFAPIHWNSHYSGRGRVGVLPHRVADPLSGQPEFKHAPVAVAPWQAAWHGFIIARRPLGREPEGYWTRIPIRGGWRIELAGEAGEWPDWLKEEFSGRGEDRVEMKDAAMHRYRTALLKDGRLEMVACFERRPEALPPRHWLEALLAQDVLNDEERAALLLGRPGKAAPDRGPIVCACFGVGENDLKRAIAQGARSVEDLGILLKAGTNCGSCIPELKTLLVLSQQAAQDRCTAPGADSRIPLHEWHA